MRVVVDARTVFAANRRGTGKTLLSLYRGIAAARPGWEFVMLCQDLQSNDAPFHGLSNIRIRVVDVPGDRLNLWQDVRFPLATLMERPSVVHCPANTAPFYIHGPLVVTIHDLIPLELTPNEPATRKWTARTRRGAQRAAAILTPSRYSAQAISTHLKVPDERIFVAPWAAETSLQRVTGGNELASVRRTLGLSPGEDYLLAFGAADPRKNTSRILEAWENVRPELRSRCRLVVVGLQPEALRSLSSVSNDGVILKGFVPEEQMAGLLSASIGLCYVSLSEGFGLPILDAFACGAPVITSAVTSMPEVAGRAALIVDPTRTDEIAGAMSTLIAQPEERERLVAAGLERLETYSWSNCVQITASVLERAANV